MPTGRTDTPLAAPPCPGGAASEAQADEAGRLHRFSLRFADPEVEAAFLADYFRKSLRQVRISLLVGLFLYATFGALDPQIIPDATRSAWWIRYAMVCPLILGVLVLSFFPVFERFLQVSMVIVGFSAGMGIIAMIVCASPPGSYLYYAGLLLCCTFIHTFMRLRVLAAAAGTWSFVLIYELVAWMSMPAPIVINNSFFLLSVNVVGMWACYYMERYARADFLQQRIIHEQASQLQSALQDIEHARQQAEEQSRRDPLTNLYNRRFFENTLKFKLKKKRFADVPLSVILMDIDHFKKVNDAHGHNMGDQVLKAVAEQICRTLRQTDLPCRYGGEEYAILLPHADHESAFRVGERLRESIEGMSMRSAAGEVIGITVSIGIATAEAPESVHADTLVDHADQALYAAKKAGRNRTRTWSPVSLPRLAAG